MAAVEAARDLGAARCSWTPFMELSGTTLRFVTLSTLIVAVTAMVYQDLGSVWHANLDMGSAHCEVISGRYTRVQQGYETPAQNAADARYHACIGSYAIGPLLWAAAALAVLALVAGALYHLQPRFMVRRGRMAGLDLAAPESARLAAHLESLAAVAGLRRAPRYVVDPVNRHADGLAFGGWRYRAVCLNAGLIALLSRDEAAFRAIVLHELAHLRNRDVGITYATIAMWRSFILVTILPWVVFNLDPFLATSQWTYPPFGPAGPPMAQRFKTLWPVVVWAVLILLTRNAVLRMRERYADVRTEIWLDSPEPWLPVPDQAAGHRVRWWHTHPAPAARLAALRAPHTLVRPGFGELFAAGTAISLFWYYLQIATNQIEDSPGSTAMSVQRWAAVVLVALMVTVAVRRAAVYLREGGRGRALLARVGLAIALGLLAGNLLTNLYSTRLGGGPGSISLVQPAALISDTGLVLACVAVCYVAGAYLRVPAAAEGWGKRAATLSVLVAGVGWLAWWPFLYGFYTVPEILAGTPRLLHGYAVQSGWGGWADAALDAVLYPFLVSHIDTISSLIALALVWLPPLLLGGIQRRVLRRAVASGVVCAGVWLLFDVAGRMWVVHAVAPATRATDGFLLVFGDTEVLGAVAVVFAGAVVLGYRRTRLVPALLAASLADVLVIALLRIGASVGLHVHWLVAAGSARNSDLTFGSGLLPVLVTETAVVTMLGLLIGAALRRAARRGAMGGVGPDEDAESAPRAFHTYREWRTPAAALVLAAALVTLEVWQPDAGTGPLILAEQPTAPNVDAFTAATDYVIWFNGGGGRQVGDLTQAELSVLNTLDTISKAAVATPPLVRQLQTDCRVLSADLPAARAFPPPPDQPLLGDWDTLLGAVAPTAQACGLLLGGADSAAVIASFEHLDFTPVTSAFRLLLADEQAAIKEVSH